MSLFDKLLRLGIVGDLTETSLWTDTVFRALEQVDSEEQGIDPEAVKAAERPNSELM